MVGPAGGRSGATSNVQTSTNLYRRQQAPPMRRYLNDGATGTLPAPTSVGTCVDPTKPRISRESNMLGSTLPSREPVKRRTSRVPSSFDDLPYISLVEAGAARSSLRNNDALQTRYYPKARSMRGALPTNFEVNKKTNEQYRPRLKL